VLRICCASFGTPQTYPQRAPARPSLSRIASVFRFEYSENISFKCTWAWTGSTAQQQLVRLLIVQVEHEHGKRQVGRRLRAQVAVEQLERAVRHLARDQCVRVPDLREDALERLLLRGRVRAPVPRVGPQLAGGDAAELLDAVADLHGASLG
jgi:hypothetical protein